jgi:Tol biopolymer transport system component
MSSEDISAYARFSPDSRRLAFIQRGVLATVDLDGAARREVYRAGERGLTLSSTAWSPDGRRLACIAADWDRDPEARRGQPEDYRILLVNVEDGSAQTHRIPDVRFLGFINWI